ncbi:unnamed protein product, partial [Dovyalis caffra]
NKGFELVFERFQEFAMGKMKVIIKVDNGLLIKMARFLWIYNDDDGGSIMVVASGSYVGILEKKEGFSHKMKKFDALSIQRSYFNARIK